MNREKKKKVSGRIPRGLRNCNPLNIRKSGDNWVGQCGHDGSFAKFIDIRHGLRAAFRLLYTYDVRYGCNTVRTIINRWAPPEENNTSAYIKRVCDYSGLAENDVICVHNIAYREGACKLVAAMAYVELGGDYLSASIIREAWDMAFHP